MTGSDFPDVDELFYCLSDNGDVFSLYLFESVLVTTVIGNDALHLLTSNKNYELRVDLEDWNGNLRYAEFASFVIGSEAEKYRVHEIGNYTGTTRLSGILRLQAYFKHS